MSDFQALLDSCHARGIKVILDLVMNHSSNQNDWFVQSRNNQNGYRDWYRWSSSKPNQTGPWGQQVWHAFMGQYYYGIFYDGMPDLNYENPEAREAMMKVAEHWLSLGADGYRLDAIKYLDEDSSILENTPETFDILKEFNRRLTAINPDYFSVGEVWDYTEKIIPYLSDSVLKSCFEFDLAGCIQRAVQQGKASVVHNQMQKVESLYPRMQYSTFLTNHDQDRVFSVLNDIDQNKQSASVLLELPGVPFLYYGEEIGMTGTGDHLNIRTPMQWSPESGAGFSSSKAWRSVNSDYTSKNVEMQQLDSVSLWNHYRHSIAMRQRYEGLRRGYYLPADGQDERILAFARVWENEAVLSVHNLSNNATSATPSWAVSTLKAGVYGVFEANTQRKWGTCEIDSKGGISQWNIPELELESRSNKMFIISPYELNSVRPFELHKTLDVYPNPSHDWTQIEIPEDGELQVWNSQGQLIDRQKAAPGLHRLSTVNYPSGIYFLRLNSPQGPYTTRLLVR
jgi:glycosidase